MTSGKSLRYCSVPNRMGKRSAPCFLCFLHVFLFLCQILYVDCSRVLVVFTFWFPKLFGFFFPQPQKDSASLENKYSLGRKGYITSRVCFLISIVLDMFVLGYHLGQQISEQSHPCSVVIILNFQNKTIIYFNWKFLLILKYPTASRRLPVSWVIYQTVFWEKKLHSANFFKQYSCGHSLHLPKVLPVASKYSWLGLALRLIVRKGKMKYEDNI